MNQVNTTSRDEVECRLDFAGFLVFHCPLKPDAIETLKMLADSSHRVGPISGLCASANLVVYNDYW